MAKRFLQCIGKLENQKKLQKMKFAKFKRMGEEFKQNSKREKFHEFFRKFWKILHTINYV